MDLCTTATRRQAAVSQPEPFPNLVDARRLVHVPRLQEVGFSLPSGRPRSRVRATPRTTAESLARGRLRPQGFSARRVNKSRPLEAPVACLARRRVHVRSETQIIVSWWLWAVIGAGAFLVLSVAVSIVLAAILGRIGGEVSQLIETEVWTNAPLEREALEVPRPVDAPPSRSEHATASRRR